MSATPDVLVDSQIVEGGVLSLGATIRVPVHADELWDKLTDVETMPSFISELKQQISFITFMFFMPLYFRTLYLAKTTSAPSRRTLQLAMLESSLFSLHEVEYRVLQSGEQQCTLEYSCRLRLRMSPPGPFKGRAHATIARAVAQQLSTLYQIVTSEQQARLAQDASAAKAMPAGTAGV